MTELLVTRASREVGTIVLAHGAGAPMDSGFMNQLCQALANDGLSSVRFEFPYMQERRLCGKKRPPDRQDVLLQCFRDIHARVKSNFTGDRPLLLGGKSMGGRMASLVAEELRPDGFCCFGYPFLPPGKPDRPRTEHFFRLTVPGLILQGTRDAFGQPAQIDSAGWPEGVRLVWLEEGDHDYRPRKTSGLTQEGIIARAANHVAAFVEALSGL